jgi:electron transfer flavoprotein beta subunit
MKVAVCIKQVPNAEARLRLGRDGKGLDEEDLPFIVNESDEYALEEGLRLAERTGGEVVAFSLWRRRWRAKHSTWC